MKLNKEELAQKINALEGLDNETKSQLLELLHERKRYGLVWENHKEDVEECLRSELPVLREVKDKYIPSDDPDAPNHILIEGDNLEALTALSYTHEGKIDVIYIDPPYNTGNKDFVYNDAFVDSEDEYRHSKWLSFMAKRLKIAKRLLSDKGVIFISIDDNEQAALKLLCDEVFGEKKFIDIFIRLTTKSGKTPVDFMRSHEYVLCYANINSIFKGVSFEDASYKYEDEYLSTRGKYNLKQPLDCNSISYSKSLDYPIEYDGKIYYPGGDREAYLARKNGDYMAKDYAWRWSKDLFDFGLANGWIVFKNGRIYTKGYLNASIEKQGSAYSIVYSDKERKRSTIDFVDNNFSNDIAKKQLALINLDSNFDFPKPYNFVSALIATHQLSNATILDFFAGSGTTLHATMQLNAEDGGHRQCIIVTNNENNICEEVTYERNKRVINGYTTPKGEKIEGLHNNTLRYYKTDFVGRENTLQNRRKLVYLATDLLCIKENCYNEQPCIDKQVRFFTNKDKRLIILYNPDFIPELVEFISCLPQGEKINVYVFADGAYPYTDDFSEVLDKIELCAIPDAILNAMRRVLPKKKVKTLDAINPDKSMQAEIQQALENASVNDYKKTEIW